MTSAARIAALVLQGFVTVSAFAGGTALIIGALVPATASILVPSSEYIDGSVFDSYAIPGALLILLVAAPHAAAFVANIGRSRWAPFLTAAAGFACLIWIFVQMIVIPFSLLQVLYFSIGLLELGMALLLLEVFPGSVASPGSQRRSDVAR